MTRPNPLWCGCQECAPAPSRAFAYSSELAAQNDARRLSQEPEVWCGGCGGIDGHFTGCISAEASS